MTAEGRQVAAFKPVVTGLDEEPGPFGRDHELLAAASGATGEVAPYLYGPAVSPHLAAEMAGETIEPARLLAHARSLEGFLVAEGVGGLLVPLTPGYLVRDLAIDLGLPLVIAARPGLGTINHCLLTVEAAAGLNVRAIVMTPWPGEPDSMQRSNRATVEALAGVPVLTLPETSPDRLAEAARGLSDLWSS
jgi:dethiobiotin synthetase